MAAVLCGAAMFIGGCSDGAAASDAGATDAVLFRLGTGRYVVTGLASDRNDCMLTAPFVGALYDLEIDNNTGRTTLTQAGPTPGCTASLGCGAISNNSGALAVAMDVEASACTMHRTVESTLTLIGDLMFTLAVVRQETMRVNCLPDAAACIFSFTLTFARQSPDAGSSGG